MRFKISDVRAVSSRLRSTRPNFACGAALNAYCVGSTHTTTMKTLTKTFFIAAAAMSVASSADAQVNTFTNSTSFFNAITASNYTETFNSIPDGGSGFASPTNFSSNGFSMSALTGVGNFYGINTPPDQWLSTISVTTIAFTNFSLNVTAIGGNFFNTRDNEAFTNTPITVRVFFADSTSFQTNYTPASPSSYFGLTYNTNITALIVSNGPPAAEFTTVNNLTVGIVPEPSTYALLGLAAAGFAGFVIRRRRA